MPTIQKRSAGEEFIHGVGTVAQGESVDVGAETAEYLVEEDGTYEYAENAESVAESDADADADDSPVPLEDKTYQELRDLASEHDVSGRSDMDKAELVDALGEVV